MINESNPLTYLVTSAKVSPTDHPWLSSLAAFDFEISYHRGKANGDADGLSRIPVSGGEVNRDVLCDEQYVRPLLDRLKPVQGDGFTCSPQFFEAMCQAYSVDALGDELAELPAVYVVGARPEPVDNDLPAFMGPPHPRPESYNSRQTPVGEDFHQLRNAPTFALRPGS